MDPLSNIIALLRPHDCVAAGFDAAGDWSIQFAAHAGMKCNALLKGMCWIAVEDEAPIQLAAGDCAILPRGRPFLLSSRPMRSGQDAQILYAPVRHGGTAIYGGGGDFYMTGARFLLSGPPADTLLGSLPSLIIVRPGPEQETVRWTLDQLANELRNPRPGSALSITHLSHVLLLQVMRSHLASGAAAGVGWLAALSDPRIAPAVAAMHDCPSRSWTVQELATIAAQSRTSFAVRFRKVTGQTPIEYLTEWRMLMAADRLSRTQVSVANAAAEVGYASESAFGVAFKRVMGQAPRAFVRARDAHGDNR
ncbi:AraC family transcriptional regulator [Aestuariibius sp. 2305UL40-4]|uniref:AraC family transcriptional regulator n=1 Tax=Aestuariibius violaceus TaxID=3234132 RepID=UPI00345E14DB